MVKRNRGAIERLAKITKPGDIVTARSAVEKIVLSGYRQTPHTNSLSQLLKSDYRFERVNSQNSSANQVYVRV